MTYTADIVRFCVKPGHRNVNSWLYTRAKRLAQAMGFVRIRSYTMPGESGATLRAVGAEHLGITKGGGYSRPSRARKDMSPTCRKNRWSLTP